METTINTDNSAGSAIVASDAWRPITINIEKAKVIGHDIRRAQRAAEFAPHDEIIAKRIPGVAVDEVEAARQAIRDKYAQAQIAIDAASTPEEIKKALGL